MVPFTLYVIGNWPKHCNASSIAIGFSCLHCKLVLLVAAQSSSLCFCVQDVQVESVGDVPVKAVMEQLGTVQDILARLTPSDDSTAGKPEGWDVLSTMELILQVLVHRIHESICSSSTPGHVSRDSDGWHLASLLFEPETHVHTRTNLSVRKRTNSGRSVRQCPFQR